MRVNCRDSARVLRSFWASIESIAEAAMKLLTRNDSFDFQPAALGLAIAWAGLYLMACIVFVCFGFHYVG